MQSSLFGTIPKLPGSWEEMVSMAQPLGPTQALNRLITAEALRNRTGQVFAVGVANHRSTINPSALILWQINAICLSSPSAPE